ncbi:MAG: formate dehydrogenase accessory protein FdhE, partial [Dehalococcoidia bacterium]|nr:formate dehydrogenase accessory protein FdhE [Dehalococcoidia bacterium]
YRADERNLYRLYLCEQCKSYLKAIDLRQAGENILVPLERLLTVDMDRQGQEEGYRPGYAA